jgi:hypothetical protein
MTILSLDVAPVEIGILEIEGLLDPKTGTFYVGVPQIADQFQFLIKNAVRDIKGLLDKDFQFLKAYTKLNPKAVNVVDLKNYERVVVGLARKGNPYANSFALDLIGLSLTQLFSDAFGIKFEEEQRQIYLIARQESKDLFYELGGQISIWFDETKAERSQPKERYFTNSFDAINLGLFGKRSKQIKTELGISSGALVRDNFTTESIRRITQVQSIAAATMRKNKNMKPNDAIKFALDCSGFAKITYK